jgi:acyl-CoA thioester hydrolase
VAVRWSDKDVYGHVNNARFLTLFEEARVAAFFPTFEQGIVISRHEIDYLRQVDTGPVRIEMWISQLRAASFTVSYELFDKDVLASRAKSVCVPFNLAENYPRRLTEDERDFLKPYVETA